MQSNEAKKNVAKKLRDHVLQPMKQTFVGKDEVIELLGVSLVARENLFILGPPGTAKSALVQDMAARIQGRVFDYLLTRFTEPNEIFGPFDIRKLKEGTLVTNTEGMLPEATFVFLDELLNANSAILNSLLMVLNERIFRRGRETLSLPTMMVVGASNHLPEDESLRALFDRFLLRVNCVNVPEDSLTDVLRAGWRFESRKQAPPAVSIEEISEIQQAINDVQFDSVTERYVDLVRNLRQAGIEISDRRAVKLQRMIAASALMCGRLKAHVSDLWVLRYIWDTVEQQEILDAIVNRAIEPKSSDEDSNEDSETGETDVVTHTLASPNRGPDPERLAADLEKIARAVDSPTAQPDNANSERSILKEQLAVLAGQLQWVDDQQQRDHLQTQVDQLWKNLEDE